jgi:integrase
LRVVEALPPRFRMLAYLGTFTSLRIGELAALTRRSIDLSSGFVTVVQNQAQLNNGALFLKDPKSAAGGRTVPIPVELLDELKHHLAEYAEPGESGRVFVGANGGYIRRPELPEGLAQGPGEVRRPAGELPRPATHGQHANGTKRLLGNVCCGVVWPGICH